jgi:hypothetical protein
MGFLAASDDLVPVDAERSGGRERRMTALTSLALAAVASIASARVTPKTAASEGERRYTISFHGICQNDLAARVTGRVVRRGGQQRAS